MANPNYLDTMRNTTGNTYLQKKKRVSDGPSYGDIANAKLVNNTTPKYWSLNNYEDDTSNTGIAPQNYTYVQKTSKYGTNPNYDDEGNPLFPVADTQTGQTTPAQSTTPTTTQPTTPSYTQQLEDYKLPTMPTAPTMQNAMTRDDAQKLAEAYQKAVYAPIRDRANNSLMQKANQLGRLENGGKQTMYDMLAQNNDINNQQSAAVLQYAEDLLNNERNYTNSLNDRATQNWRYGVDDTRYGAEFGMDKIKSLLNQSNVDRQFDYGKSVDDRNYNYQVGRDAVTDNQWQNQFDRGVLESDRGYNRGVLESDRGYNRGVLESDRGYNRGVLESDRTYNQNTKQQGIDNAYRDKVFNRGVYESDRSFNKPSGGGSSGGGRRGGSGGSGKGGSGGSYNPQELGAAYIDIVLNSRNNKTNAQAQFTRDKQNLLNQGLSYKDINYIQSKIDGLDDEWTGPSYGKTKNPLSNFWKALNGNYKYVK